MIQQVALETVQTLLSVQEKWQTSMHTRKVQFPVQRFGASSFYQLWLVMVL